MCSVCFQHRVPMRATPMLLNRRLWLARAKWAVTADFARSRVLLPAQRGGRYNLHLLTQRVWRGGGAPPRPPPIPAERRANPRVLIKPRKGENRRPPPATREGVV